MAFAGTAQIGAEVELGDGGGVGRFGVEGGFGAEDAVFEVGGEFAEVTHKVPMLDVGDGAGFELGIEVMGEPAVGAGGRVADRHVLGGEARTVDVTEVADAPELDGGAVGGGAGAGGVGGDVAAVLVGRGDQLIGAAVGQVGGVLFFATELVGTDGAGGRGDGGEDAVGSFGRSGGVFDADAVVVLRFGGETGEVGGGEDGFVGGAGVGRAGRAVAVDAGGGAVFEEAGREGRVARVDEGVEGSFGGGGGALVGEHHGGGEGGGGEGERGNGRGFFFAAGIGRDKPDEVSGVRLEFSFSGDFLGGGARRDRFAGGFAARRPRFDAFEVPVGFEGGVGAAGVDVADEGGGGGVEGGHRVDFDRRFGDGFGGEGGGGDRFGGTGAVFGDEAQVVGGRRGEAGEQTTDCFGGVDAFGEFAVELFFGSFEACGAARGGGEDRNGFAATGETGCGDGEFGDGPIGEGAGEFDQVRSSPVSSPGPPVTETAPAPIPGSVMRAAWTPAASASKAIGAVSDPSKPRA